MWVAAYQPAHSRIIRFVFPDPDEPMITEWRAKERAGTVEDGPPLVPDGADDRADHDLAAPGQEGDGAGGGGPAACGADLAAPLPGVELDRVRRR